MFSTQRIGFRQCGQCEPGRTTDCSSGQRWMQTFRKLPKMRPSKNAMAVTVKKECGRCYPRSSNWYDSTVRSTIISARYC